ncbi:hypothetical protein MHYP_G00303060 [Metynnis hypsauchen]
MGCCDLLLLSWTSIFTNRVPSRRSRTAGLSAVEGVLVLLRMGCQRCSGRFSAVHTTLTEEWKLLVKSHVLLADVKVKMILAPLLNGVL